MLELESIWANIWEGRESCKGSVWGKWRKTRPHKCTVELMSMNLNPRTDWNRTVLPQTLMIWMSHMCSKCHCHGAKHTPNPAVGGTKGESGKGGKLWPVGAPHWREGQQINNPKWELQERLPQGPPWWSSGSEFPPVVQGTWVHLLAWN